MDAAMAMMAPDAVFESTGPAPDGRRLEGARRDPGGVGGDGPARRATRRSPSRRRSCPATGRPPDGGSPGRNDDGSPGHVRGVDVIRVVDGQIAEKLSYVKG